MKHFILSVLRSPKAILLKRFPISSMFIKVRIYFLLINGVVL